MPRIKGETTPRVKGEKVPDAMRKKLAVMRASGISAAGGLGPIKGKGSIGPQKNRYIR